LARLITGTGGGYGDPIDRPIKRVQEDVRNGQVTLQQAEELYGVTLQPETLELSGISAERERRGDGIRKGAKIGSRR
jgi:N-methylhydantoinase B